MLLRRWVASIAVVALLVTSGCASSPSRHEDPPLAEVRENPASSIEPAPPVVTPKVERAQYDMFVNLPDGSGYAITQLEVTGQHVKVPTLPFSFRLEFKPWPEADFRSQIHLTGGGTIRTEGTFTGAVEVSFPEGQAGSMLSITLPEVDGMESVTYHLERTEPVKMIAEVQVKGAWVPAQPDQVYPAESPQVRLTFDRPVDRSRVEQALQHSAQSPHERLRLEGITTAWPDDRTVLITFSKAPPLVAWSLNEVRGTDGLPLISTVPALHFGEPPALVAIDPATGHEEWLTALPVELRSGTASPNGHSLLLEGYRHELTGYFGPRDSRWLVMIGAQTKAMPFDGQKYLYFGPDGRLNSLDRGEGRSHTISPDGTRIAYLYMEGWGKGELPGYLYPHDLVIQSTDGQVLQVVRQVMHLYAPPKDYPLRTTLVWSPDGKRIATLTDEPDGGGAIVVIDLVTGQPERVAALPPGMGRGAPYPLAWNGEHFVVGETLFDATGAVKQRLPGAGPFSPDGKSILFRRAVEGNWDPAWGEVGLVSVATGEVKPLGEGLVLGWRADGRALVARWKDWRHRYVPMGL